MSSRFQDAIILAMEHSIGIPRRLREIPDAPKKLHMRGTLPADNLFHLTVIGSRKYTQYGKIACEMLIEGLKGYPFVIISGLALGMDTVALETAIRVGLPTIAFPGSGLSDSAIYPRANVLLANIIVERGGCLISEFENDLKATNWSFPRRNRLMAGMSDAVLVIEAENKSGTRITAKLATEYNRDVLSVPGPITSDYSGGTNQLLREGATPITCVQDILEHFHIETQTPGSFNVDDLDLTDNERVLMKQLIAPIPKGDLIKTSGLLVHEANVALSTLEIKGLIKEELGEVRRV